METPSAVEASLNRPNRLIRLLPAAALCLGAIAAPEAAAADEAPDPATIVHIETFNIEGSNHPAGYRLGTVAMRAERTAKIIKGETSAHGADIVGFQEVEPDQRRYLTNKLPGYTSVPHRSQTQNPIYFKKKRFQEMATGIVHYPYYGDSYKQRTGDAVWVRLKDKVSGKFYSIINEHSVAWNTDGGWDRGGAYKRLATARITNQWMLGMRNKHPKDIIIEEGDLNSTNHLRNKPDPAHDTPKAKDPALNGNRDLLPYCVMTQKPAYMQNTYDLIHDFYGHCANKQRNYLMNYTVDWIFTSPATANVVSYEKVKNPTTDRTSDHNPILVAISPK